ncbi:MAG: adenylate/guanylate cyclase domain-containing protein, partial [Nitrososphaeraceae archaeon]
MMIEEKREVQENEEISFSSKSQSYCVCFVSMVDSTETTFTFNDRPDRIRRYYSVFINTLAAIVRNFDAKVIKNTGTSLVYYFPKTSNSHDNISTFKDVIECGISMIAADKVINMKLKEEGLPSMHYKISADYGRVEVARSLSSPDTEDLFGSTMNVCAKINSMAP